MSSTGTSGPAPLSIDFVIVGGGISGLSTAYTLCNAGHRVRVLERASDVRHPSSGVRVPPNMSKILKKWVGDEELYKTAVLNVATPCIDMNSGTCIGVTPWKPAVMAETGGEFLMMKHEDIHSIMYRLAITAGAHVDFETTATEVRQGSPTPSVVLASGDIIYADIVIGADGWNSMVRKVVCDFEEGDEILPSGVTVYSGIATADSLRGDPELERFLRSNEWAIGFATGMTMCIYPVRANTELVFVIFVPDENDQDTPLADVESSQSWCINVPSSSIKVDGLASYLQRLISKIPSFSGLQWLKRSQAEEWIDESNRIVLLGDAAHPFPPGNTYATAACLEDAVVLGTLFSHLSCTNQITTLLHAYQEIRETRCQNLINTDISNMSLMMLPPGPVREARDKALSATIDEWDEDSVTRMEYDRLAEMFGYEAEDAAMQWWVDWGRYIQVETPENSTTFDPFIQVEKLSLDP